ncbi:MAG: hypothetical protein NUW24_08085 [Anaerolineae bacterium]|nr:hypothetical protein [Anaerolineae bacterium]MDH7472818.1 hypothetical protein [Anaerolineae bacterium]
MIAFGPIPSRRLGRSLKVNNIPPEMLRFAGEFRGRLVTETMLMAGINDVSGRIGGVQGNRTQFSGWRCRLMSLGKGTLGGR